MAKRIEDIVTIPAQVLDFPIVPCGCGCGPIHLHENEWIYCNETKSYYADMVCFTDAVGADYEPSSGRVIIEDYEYSKSEFMEEMGASRNG